MAIRLRTAGRRAVEGDVGTLSQVRSAARAFRRQVQRGAADAAETTVTGYDTRSAGGIEETFAPQERRVEVETIHNRRVVLLRRALARARRVSRTARGS